jgi:drug/metabolite transporter (DMT)-like permease
VPFPYLGEILSVLAALVWAFSVVLFRLSGRKLPPLSLNFFKNIVAACLFLLTFAVTRQSLLREAPVLDYALLALSGILGITIADTLFLKSLNLVGAGLSQIVTLSYSPFVIFFTFVFIGERLTPGDIGGAALILLGIVLSAAHKAPPGSSQHDLHKGIGLGTISVALMAAGVTLAKPVLDRSPVLWATTVRLMAGVLAFVLMAIVVPSYRHLWKTLRPSPSWKLTVPSAALGAYVAMLVWIAGMKYTQAATASILNQTSAVFVLPIAAVVLREPITLRKAGAVATAIAGTALVTIF